MKQSKLFNLFFREKPVMLLVSIFNAQSEVYASTLAKVTDCTYAHVIKLLQEFEREGLITFDKQGRLKFVTLTKKGQEIAESLDKAKNLTN